MLPSLDTLSFGLATISRVKTWNASHGFRVPFYSPHSGLSATMLMAACLSVSLMHPLAACRNARVYLKVSRAAWLSK
jgi:hypothetical protein